MLRELQAAFRAELVDANVARMPARLAGTTLVTPDRFWIYRNNFLGSLTSVLAATFPTVERLVGENNFRYLAHRFIRAHPPTQPVLDAYGDRLSRFLETLSPAVAEFPFLPDLARLEWAVQEAYFAADGAALTPETLAAMDPSAYAGLRLRLHPAARLVRSPWPIWELWDAEAVPDPLGEGPDHVLVLQTGGKVEVTLLSPGDFVFLSELDAGGTLEEAATAGRAAEPAFDLTTVLGAHLQRGTFRAIDADPPDRR